MAQPSEYGSARSLTPEEEQALLAQQSGGGRPLLNAGTYLDELIDPGSTGALAPAGTPPPPTQQIAYPTAGPAEYNPMGNAGTDYGYGQETADVYGAYQPPADPYAGQQYAFGAAEPYGTSQYAIQAGGDPTTLRSQSAYSAPPLATMNPAPSGNPISGVADAIGGGLAWLTGTQDAEAASRPGRSGRIGGAGGGGIIIPRRLPNPGDGFVAKASQGVVNTMPRIGAGAAVGLGGAWGLQAVRDQFQPSTFVSGSVPTEAAPAPPPDEPFIPDLTVLNTGESGGNYGFTGATTQQPRVRDPYEPQLWGPNDRRPVWDARNAMARVPPQGSGTTLDPLAILSAGIEQTFGPEMRGQTSRAMPPTAQRGGSVSSIPDALGAVAQDAVQNAPSFPDWFTRNVVDADKLAEWGVDTGVQDAGGQGDPYWTPTETMGQERALSRPGRMPGRANAAGIPVIEMDAEGNVLLDPTAPIRGRVPNGENVRTLTEEDVAAIMAAFPGKISEAAARDFFVGKTVMLPPEMVAVLPERGAEEAATEVVDPYAAPAEVATGGSGRAWVDYGNRSSGGGGYRRSYGGGSYGGGYGGGYRSGGNSWGGGGAPEAFFAEGFGSDDEASLWDDPIFDAYFRVLERRFGPERARVMLRGMRRTMGRGRSRSSLPTMRSKSKQNPELSAAEISGKNRRVPASSGTLPTNEGIRKDVGKRVTKAAT